jgi:hypothetical protein
MLAALVQQAMRVSSYIAQPAVAQYMRTAQHMRIAQPAAAWGVAGLCGASDSRKGPGLLGTPVAELQQLLPGRGASAILQQHCAQVSDVLNC